MRGIIEKIMKSFLSNRMVKNAMRTEIEPRLKATALQPLTSSEEKAVRDVWGRFNRNLDYRLWALYKTHVGFCSEFVPDDLYVKDMVRALNPIRMVYCLQNKNCYSLLYQELPQPKTLFSCIRGNIYDSNHNTVHRPLIYNILAIGGGNKVILKPSSDSCSGNGVKIIDTNYVSEADFYNILDGMGNYWVCQTLVEQSSLTARFNENSLNTFRINTLNINGSTTVVNIMFRHGRNGSIVDNGGAGGICCGVLPNGKFIGTAFDTQLKQYFLTPFGKQYSEIEIEEIKTLSKLAIRSHKRYLPMMGHAAWDFALDSNNNPVFIEVNLGWPGILLEQMCCKAPIFGSRTKEVIDYVLENRNRTEWSEFVGHWM